MVLSSLPLPSPLSLSLSFSLSPVQHPGLKILRSDSSSSISSRIGWVSPLSLMLSLSLLIACHLFLLDSLLLLLISSLSSSASLLLFFSPVIFIFPLHFFSSSLVWCVGLALLLCLADCDHLTNVMSPHCSALPLS